MTALSDRPPPPRGPWWLRAAPIDGVALLVIATAIVVTHLQLVRRGMAFDDPSWCFHFGRRTLAGATPYRDYVYQAGPMPIYVDGLFQAVFGSSYAASLDAAMAITILRVFAVWMVVRRVAGRGAAALLAVWCVLDPVFAVKHDASASYAQLFVVLAGLFLLLASQHGGASPSDPPSEAPRDPAARDRRAPRYLAFAGASAGLVVASRQGAAVAIGIVALIATAILYARREYFTRRRFLALWGGFGAGIAVVLGLLAIAGALGPALQQMFLDAPAKPGIHGVAAIFDAISGGGLVDPYRSWWGGFLVNLGLPVAAVTATTCLVAYDRKIASSTVAMIAMAALVLIGLYLPYALLSWFTDLPRMLLTVITVLAVGSPSRVRRWFGVEPLIAIGLGALPLASDWALQASLPGRDASDAPSLVTGALLITLATRHLASRTKALLCGGFAIAAIVHFAVAFHAHVNPLTDPDAGDGTLRDNKLRTGNPVMRDLRISEPKRKATEWLTSQVTPGSTCFIYGNAPVLYDVLDCHNPTRVDTTAAGSLTAADAEEALAVLRRHPPDYLVAHDKTAMLPALTAELDGRLESYGGFNPEPIRVLHLGLRALLDQYEPVGVVGDVLGDTLARSADALPDHLNAIRLYRRKR